MDHQKPRCHVSHAVLGGPMSYPSWSGQSNRHFPARELMHVQTLRSGAPQALLGGESFEVEVGELPGRVELPIK
jgi:hypothetical protein